MPTATEPADASQRALLRPRGAGAASDLDRSPEPLGPTPIGTRARRPAVALAPTRLWRTE